MGRTAPGAGAGRAAVPGGADTGTRAASPGDGRLLTMRRGSSPSARPSVGPPTAVGCSVAAAAVRAGSVVVGDAPAAEPAGEVPVVRTGGLAVAEDASLDVDETAVAADGEAPDADVGAFEVMSGDALPDALDVALPVGVVTVAAPREVPGVDPAGDPALDAGVAAGPAADAAGWPAADAAVAWPVADAAFAGSTAGVVAAWRVSDTVVDGLAVAAAAAFAGAVGRAVPLSPTVAVSTCGDAGEPGDAGADPLRVGAAPALADAPTEVGSETRSGAPTVTGAAGVGSVTTAGFFEPFFPALTSSGCSARVRPSRSARRRSRSACASISVEEWLFTPTPITSLRAIISAFVIPSSLASSCTRMFFGKAWSAFHQRRSVGAGADGQQFCHVGDNAFDGVPQRGQRVGIDRSLPRPLEPAASSREIEALQ